MIRFARLDNHLFSHLSRLATGLIAIPLLLAEPAWSHDPHPRLSTGQSVYVPVYSTIWHGNLNDNGKPSEILMSSMLSIRNTDPKYGMTITSAQYYDTGGRKLHEYVARPRLIPPMGSVDFFVEYQERQGGTGANFVVNWQAEQPINQPIMETIHVYHWGTQGQAFVTRGEVIDPHEPNRAGQDSLPGIPEAPKAR
ncbi:MAG: DUF3124 domain-containing protein [Magnetococcales bacterium]|nr:DUF3124 domain-containing protein [Magnetococcales bacterium]